MHMVLRSQDIERIYQDVINAQGLGVSLLCIDRTETGWRIAAKDRGDRVVSVHVPDGPAAAVRATLACWTAEHVQLDASIGRRGGC
jgi:hypothetical protein